MKALKKGLAIVAVTAVLAGSFGCSSVERDAKAVADSFINSLISMDIESCNELSIDRNSCLDIYMHPDYKTKAVSVILGATHYRYEPISSGTSDGQATVVYTLVMPNINASIEANPSDLDEFTELLNTRGKTDVTVSVNLRKNEDKWEVINAADIARDLYGSLYAPVYAFVLDGYMTFSDPSWESSNEDGSFQNTESITCHYDLTDEFLMSGVDLDLMYEFYKNDELVYAGRAIMDEDGSGVSFTLDVNDTGLDFDYLPQFDYQLIIYNRGSVYYADHQECTLSAMLFPDATAIDNISWQYTDRAGIYFNCSDIVAKVWINDRYIESGRPLNITYDVFCNGQIELRGRQAQVYDNIAICVYEEDILKTGNYSINVYNNSTFAGSSVTSVILNLDPELYTELPTPSTVEDANDEPRARLEVFTGSRNSTDIANRYADVSFNTTSIPMNIFPERMDSILATGEDAPDLIICDASYARRFAESPFTRPVNDIGISYSELQYMYEYTFALAKDRDFVIKGVSWEITPGAVFYSRSAMRSVLGVSEPGDVSPFFSTWDSVLETANYVYEASAGSKRLICTTNEIEDPYLFGRSESWFDADGNIDTPQYMEDYLSILSAFENNDLTFDCTRWSSEWNTRLSNRTVLSYFGTLRFGELFLKGYGSGDWGLVMPPVNYYDGGNYIFVTSYCDMDASAARFIRNMTTNENNLYDMAEDGITVNNISVMMSCASDDNYSRSYLNGQNPFRIFSEVARGIDASSVTPYDYAINEVFADMSREYLSGRYQDAQEATAAFEQAAREALG